jgi:hypothetical protein
LTFQGVAISSLKALNELRLFREREKMPDPAFAIALRIVRQVMIKCVQRLAFVDPLA